MGPLWTVGNLDEIWFRNCLKNAQHQLFHQIFGKTIEQLDKNKPMPSQYFWRKKLQDNVNVLLYFSVEKLNLSFLPYLRTGGLIFSSEAGDFGGETSQSVLNEGEKLAHQDALSRDINAFDQTALIIHNFELSFWVWLVML